MYIFGNHFLVNFSAATVFYWTILFPHMDSQTKQNNLSHWTDDKNNKLWIYMLSLRYHSFFSRLSSPKLWTVYGFYSTMWLQQTGAVSPLGPPKWSGLCGQRLHSAFQWEQARHAAGQGPQIGYVAAGPHWRLWRLWVFYGTQIVLFFWSVVEQQEWVVISYF